MKSLILGLGLALAIAAPAVAVERGHDRGARAAHHETYRGGNREYRPGHRYDDFYGALYGYHVRCGLGAAVLVSCGYQD